MVKLQIRFHGSRAWLLVDFEGIYLVAAWQLAVRVSSFDKSQLRVLENGVKSAEAPGIRWKELPDVEATNDPTLTCRRVGEWTRQNG